MSDKPKIAAGNAVQSFVPTDVDSAWRLAEALAQSSLAGGFKGKTSDVFGAMVYGADLGFSPMQALQSIAIINNRPSIWGDALPALLWSRGFKIREWTDEGENGDLCAYCQITRPDGTELDAVRFSESDAKTAGLWAKAGPWKLYPKRMLQMRARSWACRDGAADVLRGLYVAEEAHDIPMRDITPSEPEIPEDVAAALSAPEEPLSPHAAEGEPEPTDDVEDIAIEDGDDGDVDIPQAYEAGIQAALRGDSEAACTAPEGPAREAWMDGHASTKRLSEQAPDDRCADTPDMLEAQA